MFLTSCMEVKKEFSALEIHLSTCCTRAEFQGMLPWNPVLLCLFKGTFIQQYCARKINDSLTLVLKECHQNTIFWCQYSSTLIKSSDHVLFWYASLRWMYEQLNGCSFELVLKTLCILQYLQWFLQCLSSLQPNQIDKCGKVVAVSFWSCLLQFLPVILYSDQGEVGQTFTSSN